MIKNTICAYCRIPLKVSENESNSRSVEHVIPNVALTRKRGKGEGDFYACRRCNGRKSHMDNLLGKVSKIQSADSSLATETFIKEVDAKQKRFTSVVKTIHATALGGGALLPFNGEELLEYMEFLGKGLFLKTTGEVFDPHKWVMVFEFISRNVLKSVEKQYKQVHGSAHNPFRDLEKNAFSETVNQGECIVYSKKRQHLIIFHDYTAIIVKTLRATKKNKIKVTKNKKYFVKQFIANKRLFNRH